MKAFYLFLGVIIAALPLPLPAQDREPPGTVIETRSEIGILTLEFHRIVNAARRYRKLYRRLPPAEYDAFFLALSGRNPKRVQFLKWKELRKNKAGRVVERSGDQYVILRGKNTLTIVSNQFGLRQVVTSGE